MKREDFLLDGTCETDSLSEYDAIPINKMLLFKYLAVYLLILFIAFLAGFYNGL
jgi:hypothetical protein